VDYNTEYTKNDVDVPVIYYGDPITDRKSKFQAHIAAVHSIEEVNAVVSDLMRDKRIATAAHNIYAYRFLQDDTMHENRNDDGETGAGDRLLYVYHGKTKLCKCGSGGDTVVWWDIVGN